MRNFRKFEIWHIGIDLADEVYSSLELIPVEEKYGLRSQITRAAVSVSLNIAEGSSRKSDKDFRRFLEYSLGSCYEIETVIILCERRNFMSQERIEKLNEMLIPLEKQITSFINRLG